MQSVAITAAQQVTQRSLPTLERRVDEAIAEKPEAIDLLLSHIQIVDSVSLNWLIAIHARLETLGIRLRLVDPSPVMVDVLAATRLDSRFTVEVSGHDANGDGGTHGR
jgi:anti-anti-sigma factor